MDIDFSKVKIDRLSRVYDVSKFECKDGDLNDFIRNDAFTYQEKKLATTTLFIYNDEIIGFFSASSDSLKLKYEEKKNHNIHEKKIQEFPAIKIARLARDTKYAKLGLGANILRIAIGYILECSDMVAVRFVTVDAYPDKVGFYEKFGFVRNEDRHYTKKEFHVSMRYDLFNGIPK